MSVQVEANGKPHAALPATTELFGIEIETAEPAVLLRKIVGFAGSDQKRRVMYANAHVLNKSVESPELRQSLLEADLVYCDGYGVRLAAQAIGEPVPERMTGADWVWGLAPLCEAAGYSVYLLGSEEDVAAEAAAALRRWYPRLRLVGHHHGYFDLDGPHNERVIEHLAEVKPDILMVGMGTPKQERWVHKEIDRIDAKVIWTVGALFDYVSGRMPRAPRWLSDNGLEWIYRLAVEPRRMWRRYLIGNPIFLKRVMNEAREHRRSEFGHGGEVQGTR
jgi:N-acetylglucosaminyldiphosphoundecaprenol N-acetyl-beta-D-mannosaminyltransferase